MDKVDPTIVGYACETGGVLCGPCPYCYGWHSHGSGGHKISHCGPGGYDIHIIGEATTQLVTAVMHLSWTKSTNRKRKLQAIIDKEKALIYSVCEWNKKMLHSTK